MIDSAITVKSKKLIPIILFCFFVLGNVVFLVSDFGIKDFGKAYKKDAVEAILAGVVIGCGMLSILWLAIFSWCNKISLTADALIVKTFWLQTKSFSLNNLADVQVKQQRVGLLLVSNCIASFGPHGKRTPVSISSAIFSKDKVLELAKTLRDKLN